jgi:alcohol dehydrogenase
MRAVCFAGDGRVEVRSVRDPHVESPTDAVVRVEVAGVCGTDLHLLHDGDDRLPAGTVLGHEFVGEVTEVGAAVTTLGVGDRVVGSDIVACGLCWWCRRGDHWECRERRFFGSGAVFGPALDGAQAEAVRVPFADVSLAALPDAIPADRAVFLADVLPTGYAAARRAGVGPGDVVVVVGGGPVGQMASLAAQTCGAAAVVVSEPIPGRRAVADRLGGIGAPPDDIERLVGELTEGRGADVVIDAVGGDAPLRAAFAAARRRGTIVSVGVPRGPEFALPVDAAFRDELTLGFVIGDPIRHRDELLALVGTDLIDPSPVVTDVVPLQQAGEAYRRAEDGSSMKLLLAGGR